MTNDIGLNNKILANCLRIAQENNVKLFKAYGLEPPVYSTKNPYLSEYNMDEEEKVQEIDFEGRDENTKIKQRKRGSKRVSIADEDDIEKQ